MGDQQVAAGQGQTDAGGNGVILGRKLLLGSGAAISAEEPTVFDRGDTKHL
jgi:hypothetical protein